MRTTRTPTTTSASSFARQGRVADAEAAYRAAIAIDPDHTDAHHNLGVLLNGLGRDAEAARCFSKVITLRPKHPEARRLLALAHYTLGEVDKAIDIFDEWLREEPDDPIARHMLAACSGRDVPARASDAFIETTFDSFAASFDAKLASLAYRAPALVAEMLARARRRRVPKPGRRSTPAAVPGSADRSSRRTRGAWSGSTCPRRCSLERASGTSTTSWSGAS